MRQRGLKNEESRVDHQWRTRTSIIGVPSRTPDPVHWVGDVGWKAWRTVGWIILKKIDKLLRQRGHGELQYQESIKFKSFIERDERCFVRETERKEKCKTENAQQVNRVQKLKLLSFLFLLFQSNRSCRTTTGKKNQAIENTTMLHNAEDRWRQAEDLLT